ncbi:MAG: FHA domain-containing protein [Myxococcota bacterium]
MLRPDLAPFDVFLADAMLLPAAEFVRRHPWPVLVIPEPDWAKIQRLSRPETLGASGPSALELIDPRSPTASAASLDALCLPLRPKNGEAFDRISIGRAEDGDVILIDETISKLHAELSWNPEAERCFLTDLGSRNGTTVDGERLGPRTPVELMPGAPVVFGSLVTRYYAPRAFYTWLAGGAQRLGAPPRSRS